MTRRFQLQPLLDLSRNRVDDAARRLSQLQGQVQAAETRLQQLLAYSGEYQARLKGALTGGLSVTVWRDYQAFLGKLDTAVRQQREEVQRCKDRWEEGRRAWLHERRGEKAFDTLAQRHRSQQQRREAKLEQRDLDEYASRHGGKGGHG